MLCGGSSRRLGTDKAGVLLGGVPLALLVGRVARAAGAIRVVGVGPRPPVAAALEADAMEALADGWPGEGPAAGVATALASARSPVAVILGCDYPRLRPVTLTRLTERLADDPSAGAVVASSDGRVHATVGAWRTAHCRQVAHDYVVGGGRSLVGLAAAVGAVVEPVDASELLDVDTPDALDVARLEAAPDTLHAVSTESPIPAIDVAALATLHAEGVPVVDVRQPDEYAEGHVPGARLVPLADVPDRVDAFPADRPVYVVCRSGGRSASAVGFLRAAGVDAINVDGGTLAWIEAGHPVVEGGEPG